MPDREWFELVRDCEAALTEIRPVQINMNNLISEMLAHPDPRRRSDIIQELLDWNKRFALIQDEILECHGMLESVRQYFWDENTRLYNEIIRISMEIRSLEEVDERISKEIFSSDDDEARLSLEIRLSEDALQLSSLREVVARNEATQEENKEHLIKTERCLARIHVTTVKVNAASLGWDCADLLNNYRNTINHGKNIQEQVQIKIASKIQEICGFIKDSVFYVGTDRRLDMSRFILRLSDVQACWV